MAPRSFWKGYLKLSLVTCPVAMSPALSDSEKVRFHTLNRETGHRVQSVYVDAETGRPVAEEDEVKGYPTSPDRFVMLEDDEIASVALESTRTIDIESFVPAESIPWIWHDQPHFLVPDDKVGEEAFTVIREAMAEADVVGISRLVLYRRERAVLLAPRGKGILVWTLRYGDEVRDEAGLGAAGEADPDPAMVAMMATLIEKRTRHWSPAMASDPVQASLLDLIASRRRGRKPARTKPAAAEPQGNVVNIMDALRRSIAAETKGPAKRR